MKVYIAASYPLKSEARRLRDYLTGRGIQVAGRWMDRIDKPDDSLQLNGAEHALTDEEDLRSSQAVVCITGDNLTKGGRHGEVGMAIGLRMPVILLGPRENVWHYHPSVTAVAEYEEVRKKIDDLTIYRYLNGIKQ